MVCTAKNIFDTDDIEDDSKEFTSVWWLLQYFLFIVDYFIVFFMIKNQTRFL